MLDPEAAQSDDEGFMRIALMEAESASRSGEVPVGAVLVGDNEILSRAANAPISRGDPTAHAEILAIREACNRRNSYRLPGTTLYVTLEPCLMCVGALVHSRVARVVYGASEPKFGALESVVRFPELRQPHRLETRSGLLERECSDILVRFFRARR